MSKEIPPELRTVLRRLEGVVDVHKEKLDFIQGRWATLHRKEPPDPEQVRRAAERPDASPELKALAAAVRAGRTTWAKVVAGQADHLPEVRAFVEAERNRMVGRIRAANNEPAPNPAPRRRRRGRDELHGLDDRDPAIFEEW